MSDAVALMALPFAAAVVFVLIHAYFGIHVLRRKIVFADLALAQLSALGATVAFANGHAVISAAGFAYALLFTALGAALLTLMRTMARSVSPEALIGILYVTATAASVLIIDRSPQGAEHVKKMLIGSILTVSGADVLKFCILYAAIGCLHWLWRRPLLALSGDQSTPAGRSSRALWLADFFFFLTFGVVVTSSVTTAGVLLVFSLLIVPAVIGSIFSAKLPVVLVIAWSVGIIASAVGLAGSYLLDLPTGATLVMALAGCLLLAGLFKSLVFVERDRRLAHRRTATHSLTTISLIGILASAVWLIINPAGDHPLLTLGERAVGAGPIQFLTPSERDTFENAARDMVRFRREADSLDAKERVARYEGTPLADDDIRRIASYQQSFNEMTRGEQFVQEVLREKARRRERWIVGLPAAVLALLGLWWVLARSRNPVG